METTPPEDDVTNATTTTTTNSDDPSPENETLISETQNPNSDVPGGDSSPPPRKRRRRKKQFPEMIPFRLLRAHSRSIVNKSIEHTNEIPVKIHRRRRISELTKEDDVEALIAISVGFPVDSLTEEEIEANVVSQIGGNEQTSYINVRNHILSRWRSNVSIWLTKEQVQESVRPENLGFVDSAYYFLLNHGYINFGLAPAIKEEKLKSPNGVEKSNVIIIGAGLSGLVAARQLIFLGFKVVVLEGRNRPGGRVKTRTMNGNGMVVAADLGGSVLTGINGNPLGVLARQLEFPLHKVRDICPLYLPDGRLVNSEVDSRVEVSFNKLLDRVCKLRQVMMEDCNSVDVSLGTAFEAFRRINSVAEDPQEMMLLNWHLANLEYANASLMSDLSMAYWDQDDPYEMGGDHCFIPGGNERFVRGLAEELPICYGKTVDSIRYGVDGARVYAGGLEFSSDMVLCTVPLGVLKKGSIEFVPELPRRKIDAIHKIGFGLLNKVAMLFPYDFWGGGIDTFGHLTEDPSMRGEFFLFYSYSAVSGGPLLVALVAGEAAIKFEMVSPVESVRRVLDILRGIFNPKGINVPDPLQVVCTQWGKDEFSYGSYSYVATGSSGDEYDILAESVGGGRVFFAGEATNRQYPATMHGAFLSGMREAANILSMAKRRSIAPWEKIDDHKEESKDLDALFESPDLKFGNFSVLYDPRSDDPESNSLLRAEFSGKIIGFGSLHLYGLLPKKQAIELSEVDEEAYRMKMLYNKFAVRLFGRMEVYDVAESLIACIKSARSNSNGSLDQ
ncbi:Amine oxidase [Dillenia turbinata]|uniref:Amine oxidase n=1 Tax=Dillenia turbinata TaxID=194707 RepID=A0AAN8UG41_9MAGN